MRAVTRIQVAVVGAGPVGAVAAYFLAQQGIDVVVLEATSSCEEDMRASTFHAPTLDMLSQLGIADRLINEGLIAPVYQYRIRSTQEILKFDLTELEDELKFPFRLQYEQSKLTRSLTDDLCGKLVAILNDGADQHELLDQYDRQRRTIMNEFIQSQTIRNKILMEESSELALQNKCEEIRRINADDELRHDFMRQQSMLQSLKDEARII